MVVSFTALTQSMMIWEEHLNEELSTLGWPVGMPMGGSLNQVCMGWEDSATSSIIQGVLNGARGEKTVPKSSLPRWAVTYELEISPGWFLSGSFFIQRNRNKNNR